ncbi:hypothetical protein ISCGN_011471 [Ixodes scapularis]
MRDAAITLVHRRQPAVHERARAVSCSTCSELQRGCRTSPETKIPSMHCGSGGVVKLAGEIGLLSQSHIPEFWDEDKATSEDANHFSRKAPSPRTFITLSETKVSELSCTSWMVSTSARSSRNWCAELLSVWCDMNSWWLESPNQNKPSSEAGFL